MRQQSKKKKKYIEEKYYWKVNLGQKGEQLVLHIPADPTLAAALGRRAP